MSFQKFIFFPLSHICTYISIILLLSFKYQCIQKKSLLVYLTVYSCSSCMYNLWWCFRLLGKTCSPFWMQWAGSLWMKKVQLCNLGGNCKHGVHTLNQPSSMVKVTCPLYKIFLLKAVLYYKSFDPTPLPPILLYPLRWLVTVLSTC